LKIRHLLGHYLTVPVPQAVCDLRGIYFKPYHNEVQTFTHVYFALLIGQNLLAAVPVITSFSPASGPVGTLVTITGTDLATPTAFSIGGKPAIVISNTGTKLVGMVMPGATTGSITVTTSAGTATSSTNFTVLSTPKPGVQQGNKLVDGTPVNSLPTISLGFKVVVSADGNTAAVTGYNSDGGDFAVGFVDVFVRNNNLWSQQGGRLFHSFNNGNSVSDIAISADGNLIVAGYGGDSNGKGSIWTFRRSGTTWTSMSEADQFLGTGGSATARQGSSVALSADGNTLVEAGTGDNSNQGAIWVFKYNGSKWIQQGSKITVSDNIGAAQLGFKVVISSDGKTILASSSIDNSNVGATWVFVLNGSSWVQQAKLIGTGAVGAARQGVSVAINANGNTAVIGGQIDNNRKGAVWVFTRTGSTWTQQGNKLVASAPGDVIFQGNTVSVTADGNTIIEGGASPISKTGLAWLFSRVSGNWTQYGNALVVSGVADKPAEQANYYHTVAISANGSAAMLGIPFDGETGSMFTFSNISTSPVISSVSPASGAVGTVITISGSNMTGASSVTIGGRAAIVLSNTSTQLAAMVMPGSVTGNITIASPGGTGTGGNFTVTPTTYPISQQAAKLVGTGSSGPARQGSALAVSADGNTAVVGGWRDGSVNQNSGNSSVWIFTRSGSVWTQQGPKLAGKANVGTGSILNQSIAISADGNTILVGASGDAGARGATWVYTRSGGVWTQQGNKLYGSGVVGTTPKQGTSVSLSADGNTA
jgi:hypothetical protein